MAFNPAVTDLGEYANEDRRWIKTLLGYDQCRSITLDVSTFAAGHLAATGAIPSGVVLGKITATGKYGPYDTDGADGRQVAAGFLFNSVNLVTAPGPGADAALASLPDVGATLYWGPGIVDQDKLPTFTVTGNEGLLDSAARTDLAAHIRFEGTDL
jgi:hypothetical protein